MNAVTIELRTSRGVTAAHLRITTATVGSSAGTTTARVLENSRAQFFLDGDDLVSLEPEELFSPDEEPGGSGLIERGRFDSGSFVGTVEVRAERRDGEVLTGWLEVHSRKIDFESQYRWMLSGVASEGAELLLRRFSPSELTLRADHTQSPKANYQRVAFLSAIIRRPHTIEAIERILRSPYVSYRDDPIEQPAGRGVAGSSRTVRALTAPGPRQLVRSGLTVGSLPTTVQDFRSEATIDNLPNRHVRFVLDHWANSLDRVERTMTGDTAAERRGRRQVAELLDSVEQWRTDRRFADVGRLQASPGGNQAVHRRPGYREITQAFAESEAAAMLTWEGGDDVHRAGQQDIAQLYEYWCYLELRRIVERLCVHADSGDLVELSDNEMHLVLKRGRQQVVDGHLVHGGRMIDVELWFNRSFGGTETWTLQMRPDVSVRFRAQTDAEPVETWVHFDAKYKIDAPADLFVGDDELPDDESERSAVRRAKRADLLKMHAYHDAIRSSAGSFVLFPGTSETRLTKHDEVLPGIGALPFVPTSDGHASTRSAEGVEELLTSILDHIAHQASSRERAAWWEKEANRRSPDPTGLFVPLGRPPADVSVLIGFCRSEAHRDWVEDAGLYNLRLGPRRGAIALTGAEASAETLLLWTADSDEVRAWTLTDHLEQAHAAKMRRLRYPHDPSGSYLLRTLDRRFEVPEEITAAVARAFNPDEPFGAPIATDWGTVLAMVSG